MQSLTLQTLLREAKNAPELTVTVRKPGTVTVVYTPGGKMYDYRGTVKQVAERLDVIPEIDIWEHAHRVVAEIAENGSSKGPVVVWDTVNYLINADATKALISENEEIDEYGNVCKTYQLIERTSW